MTFWTPERDETLISLVGKMSHSNIGRAFGISKSAVQHRLRRLRTKEPARFSDPMQIAEGHYAATPRCYELIMKAMR